MSSRIIVISGIVAALALSTGAGCLRRDVSAEEPTTKISFDTVVPQPAIDKVDLLVMVDNSSSMADKQKILADAVPDLLRGLVQPKCVDKKTRLATGTLADPLKEEGAQCPSGTEPAFPPITDMHIGVITSSLGGMGSSTSCRRDEPKHHNDDRGRLVSRGAGGGNIAQAGDLGFLAWYPDVLQNQDKKRHPDPPVPKTASIKQLGDSFHDLVVGVGQDGCGLEAQLESIYRFLVQPDPWTEITVTNGAASYGPADQVDVELLKQRAAFLRPDSLVAVVLLSDEDDSSADPLAFQGTAWRFETPGTGVTKDCPDCEALPRATAACAHDPSSAACTSCQFNPKDASCSVNGGVYTAAEDPLNVRFVDMKRRFGVDPQFPMSRYVDAFTKKVVPRRASEHDKGAYVGKADCTNPLFAAHLPSQPNEELCKLAKGTRTPDLVYFAVIGGVPNKLLPSDPSATIDWTKILGKDPLHYDESGIDPHMIASTTPRAGLPGPDSPDDADPVSGREWNTGGDDLQFACTFPLYERQMDGTSVPASNTCAEGDQTCDCNGKQSPPLCQKSNPLVQVRGKAYPTRRELLMARELGDHAVVASLCPKQLTAPERDDYGYRPAVRAITDRLESTLTASCLPRPLARDPKDQSVSCLVVATLPDPGSDDACTKLGLGLPPADVLKQLRDRVAAENGEESRKQPVCEIPQIAVARGASCRDEDQRHGFCYAENVPGVHCAQALLFTKPTTHLAGATFSMQCITVGSSAPPP